MLEKYGQGDLGQMFLDSFIEKIRDEVDSKNPLDKYKWFPNLIKKGYGKWGIAKQNTLYIRKSPS
jgi:hypothetical protein